MSYAAVVATATPATSTAAPAAPRPVTRPVSLLDLQLTDPRVQPSPFPMSTPYTLTHDPTNGHYVLTAIPPTNPPPPAPTAIVLPSQAPPQFFPDRHYGNHFPYGARRPYPGPRPKQADQTKDKQTNTVPASDSASTKTAAPTPTAPDTTKTKDKNLDRDRTLINVIKGKIGLTQDIPHLHAIKAVFPDLPPLPRMVYTNDTSNDTILKLVKLQYQTQDVTLLKDVDTKPTIPEQLTDPSLTYDPVVTMNPQRPLVYKTDPPPVGSGLESVHTRLTDLACAFQTQETRVRFAMIDYANRYKEFMLITKVTSGCMVYDKDFTPTKYSLDLIRTLKHAYLLLQSDILVAQTLQTQHNDLLMEYQSRIVKFLNPPPPPKASPPKSPKPLSRKNGKSNQTYKTKSRKQSDKIKDLERKLAAANKLLLSQQVTPVTKPQPTTPVRRSLETQLNEMSVSSPPPRPNPPALVPIVVISRADAAAADAAAAAAVPVPDAVTMAVDLSKTDACPDAAAAAA